MTSLKSESAPVELLYSQHIRLHTWQALTVNCKTSMSCISCMYIKSIHCSGGGVFMTAICHQLHTRLACLHAAACKHKLAVFALRRCTQKLLLRVCLSLHYSLCSNRILFHLTMQSFPAFAFASTWPCSHACLPACYKMPDYHPEASTYLDRTSTFHVNH